MTRTSAGVLAGVVLGALHGLWIARGDATSGAVVGAVLGRASQGIINGILAAYAARGQNPVVRATLWGGAIGAALGVLRGLAHRQWTEAVTLSAIVGLGCGLAAGLAKRRGPPPAAAGPAA